MALLRVAVLTFAAHLAWQVESADLSDPANLGARFRSNGAVAPVVLVGYCGGDAE